MLKIKDFNGKYGNLAAVDSLQEAASVALQQEEEKNKPTASFKLKKAFAESAERYDIKKPETAPAVSAQVEAHDAFDEVKVREVWDRLIQQQHPETIVSIALKSHAPEIEGDRIIVKVDNQIQVEKLEAIRHNLQNALMQGLNNGFVRLEIQIFENTSGKEERRLITAQDKLAYFIEENPVVAEMKKLFGLELE